MSTPLFESWFKRENNNSDLCFLCGRDLNQDNRSNEHIFPKWVLKKFDLWDKKINLLNDSTFNYSKAVIPCCKSCNNDYLSQLESGIKYSFDQGFDYFSQNLTTLEVYKWCQLIFYKILYKEQFLKSDITDPNSEKIVSEVQFNSMKLNHLFLRSIDKEIKFRNFFPGSIFIVNLKTSLKNEPLNFDFIDSVPEQCFAIRINDVGIIAILSDGDLQKMLFEEEYKDFLSHELAPIQFKNFFAKCLYRQTLFRDPFKYVVEPQTENRAIINRVYKEHFSGDVYLEGDSEQYLQLLGSVFNCDPEALRLKNGMAGSFFYDLNGNWKDRPFEDNGVLENV